ncbi:uncharacterized protein LOC117648399 [Thrips palmi]|uniref:Uncharacterized protein LOC117648399 n=1 Tax=Thrips palmi TaxID=161013 RepID=A0A6P8ZCV1_THRPL|nr:uncharacterized protein LOC117648399 [Thrips palmi]
MKSTVAKVPISSDSGSKNTAVKPQAALSQPVKRKKRRRGRRTLFYRTKQKTKKPTVSGIEIEICPTTFDSDSEVDRNVSSSLKAKDHEADQSLDAGVLSDQNVTRTENGVGALHAVSPAKAAVGSKSDLSPNIKEADRSTVLEMKCKTRRRGRRSLFYTAKQTTKKSTVHAIEVETRPPTFDLDTEEDRNVKAKDHEADKSLDEEVLSDHNEDVGSAIHTSTPVKVTVSNKADEINEAEQSTIVEIKLELHDHDSEREVQEIGPSAIHSSTPVTATMGGQSELSLASATCLSIDPFLSDDGITRHQVTIKNCDSTLSVTIGNDSTQPSTAPLKIPTENNIYSRIDEVRVPLIVNWSNGSLSNSGPPSSMTDGASPTYGPHIMPQFDGVSVDLIDSLLKHLKCFLPAPWQPISRQNGVSALVFSSGELTPVEKVVFVDYEQGSVKIGILSKSVPENHSIWKETGNKLPLRHDNVQAFSNRVVKIVNAVCQMKVCPGIESNEVNSKILSSRKDVTLDDNVFDDSCYRSKHCSLLVPLRRKKCATCCRLADIIYARERRIAASKKLINNRTTTSGESQNRTKTPKRNTRHDYLTSSASKRLLKIKQQKIKLSDQTIRRLTARIVKMLDTEGIDIDCQLSKNLNIVLKNNKLTDIQKIFLEQQMRASAVKSKTGMRWHPMMIRFALHLKSISPAAYDAARQSGMIALPCVRTLFDYSSVYKPETGTNAKILEDISKKVSELKESYQKFHVLMFDEMTTSQNLVYSKETGELFGYAHLSEVSKEMNELQRQLEGEKEVECTPPIADHMLTYMIKGTASGVKEAVASYPTKKLTKEQLYERTWDVIGNLELAGVAVVALISDGNTVNRAFYQMHVPVTTNENGIVFDTVNFCSAEGRTLYFFNDVPHLLKCIRNNFMSSGIHPAKTRLLMKNGQIITWDTIVRMFMEEKDETWTFGYKLNQQNVYPDSYSRMRVPLAAQVMSDTVSKMIGILGYKDCEETAIFIKKVNDFFDMLNGAHSDQEMKTRNKNLARYDNHFDPRFTELLDFLKYLKEWKEDARAATIHLQKKDEECSARQLSWQTQEGIERTIHAFIGCTRFLLASGQKYVMARVFCQDPLEQYFSHQRAMGGGNRNPNADTFLRNMNSIHIVGETGFKRKRGNTLATSSEGMSVLSTPMEKKPRHNTKRCLAEKYPFMFSD